MAVDHVLDEVRKANSRYWIPASDCDQGEPAIKAKTTDYLPAPNCEGEDVPAGRGSDKRTERYKSYITRAVFYNIVGRTVRGFVGLVFNKDPQHNLPERMKYLLDNANGEVVGLAAQSAQALKSILLKYRSGLYVNYPRTGGQLTVGDVNSGRFLPTIHRYEPDKIINYRLGYRNGKAFTQLVVLKEEYVADDDGFEEVKKVRYRELRMVQNPDDRERLAAVVRLYNVQENGSTGARPDEQFYPKDANGDYLDHLPFYPIGAAENSWEIGVAPLYDMCVLNIGHYRNSADYEESTYTVGQPTYVATGLNQAWVDKNLNGKFNVGSRTMVPLPKEADAKILQPEPNTMAKEAMVMKQDQMTALGAKIIEQRTVARTATETSGDVVVDNSILAVCARNINSAYREALKDVARYLGVPWSEEFYFELNTDYDTRRMTAQERQQLMEEFKAGLLTFEEARYSMKRSGVGYEEDDVARATIRKDADMRRLAIEAERPAPGPNPGQTSPTPGDTGVGG